MCTFQLIGAEKGWAKNLFKSNQPTEGPKQEVCSVQ